MLLISRVNNVHTFYCICNCVNLLLISRVNNVHTFYCICNCVNSVHVCSLSVILICNSNKLYANRNKETNKQTSNTETYMFNYLIFLSACPEGYFGSNCSVICPYPYYGKLCASMCQCKKSLCHYVNGCPTNTTGN